MSLEAFFAQYREGYSQLDVDAVISHFTVPFTTIHHGDLACWQDMYSLRATTSALLEWYRAQGFAGATHQVEGVLPMDNDAACATLIWTVERNGQPPWRYRTGYHLKRTAGQWKIYGVVQYNTAPEQQTMAQPSSQPPVEAG
ncbi:nuclear transport factor 2 family protein [Chromobacterium vaccinii]|uniref:Nuclear transport factor 2 family protein n=1 Tax=Chromobacterium vaccinii TaxID=1108595 RepID=A0ABV0FHS7_9NEIS